MAVLNQEIYIGSVEDPLFYFDKDHIEEPSSMQSVDLIGGVLSIDTFEPIVSYEGPDYDGLRLLPFGTMVFYYINGSLTHKYYINKITRQSKRAFKLECVSPVGILDKSYHVGGVYYGREFGDLLSEIIGNTISYSVSDEVSHTKMFGWLPYDTKRNNLHQMLFAINASVLRDENGDLFFDYITDDPDPPYISDNRIYVSGSVEYPTIATEIDVTEHSYQYVATEDRVTLFDNSEDFPTSNTLVLFDNAPIAVQSLRATEGLDVLYSGENYAVVSGLGVLTGIPYVDKTTVVRRYYENAGEEYTVKVEDATLVSAMNSAYVADRLKSYYTSAKIVSADVKLDGEKVGHQYEFKDAFEEVSTGYLKKITTYPSSFVKASCEFITGYAAEKHGNSYDYHLLVDAPGTITIPEGTKSMRVTLIAGGDGASSGLAGEDPSFDDSSVESVYKNQEGGKGGEPGVEGYGGWIREVVINDPPAGNWTTLLGLGGEGTDWNTSPTEYIVSPNYEGGHTILYAPNGTFYTTDSNQSYVSTSGIADLFTGIVYGKKGKAGVKGGDGGRGNSNGPGEDGEDISYLGYEFKGGPGGSGVVFNFEREDRTANAGGAGGSGASAYAPSGFPGNDAEITWYYDATSTDPGYKAMEYVGIAGGCPQKLSDPLYWNYNHTPGDGGNAGCGGAGRGGYGSADKFTDKYDVTENGQTLHVQLQAGLFKATPIYATSGVGGYGEKGYQGAIIIYSDKPLTYTPKVLPTPIITSTVTALSTSITFSFVNVGSNITYSIERRPMDGSWVKFTTATYSQLGATCTFEDTGTDSGESFEYRIKALGLGLAKDSDYSNSIIIGYGATKLSAPTISAVQQSWGIKATWTAVSNANMYILAYRAKNSENDWTYIRYTSGATLEAGIVGGIDNCLYEFKICAITTDNSYIASDWSATSEASTPSVWKCWTPSITLAEYYDAGGEYDTDGIMLHWSTAYTTSANKYIIQRKSHSSSSWETIGESTNPLQGYYFNSFPTSVGDVYDYRIKSSRDDWEDSDWSSDYTVTIVHNLSAPVFESISDSGKKYVTCNVDVKGINSHTETLVFEISVNEGAWQTYKTSTLTGQQSLDGRYTDALSGGILKYGGSIRLRCYAAATGYDNSAYSNVQEIYFKERVFFWDGENNRYWDHSTKSYKTGTGGWQGMTIALDDEGTYVSGASFTKSGNNIQLTSNGYLFTSTPVCDLNAALKNIYDYVCFTGKMEANYSESDLRFGCCNLWRRSNGDTHINWKQYSSGGACYISPPTTGNDRKITEGSVSPTAIKGTDNVQGIGTYLCFFLNGGTIYFDNVFLIKK